MQNKIKLEEILLTEKEAATLLELSVITLRAWRWLKPKTFNGPPYYKIGRLVRYKKSDIENYLRENKHDQSN